MYILYDLILIFVLAIAYLPYAILRKKLHRGFTERLGFLTTDFKLNRPIWIHAVSVGEARLAGVLVSELRRLYPRKDFAISTVTPTGNSIVKAFQQDGDFVFYIPLDLSFITRRVIRRLNPCICIVVETEIWPNMIIHLHKMGVPVVLVNARISERSFFGYRIIRPFIKPILNKINLFCVQGKRDAQRLSVLGAPFDRLKVTGNMKYDIIDYKPDRIDHRLQLGLRQEERLFVAGSTHPGEEAIILGVYKRLISEFPGLRLLIAPRHPQRSSEIENLIYKFGFQTSRISGLKEAAARCVNKNIIFLLDTIGQLMSFYAIADIAFVGGSLIKKGGHNILEPAMFEKPILFGPYMFNFRDISDLFLKEGAARMVRGEEELLKEIRFLLNNPSELKTISKKARQLVLENRGATNRNVQRISLFVSHG